MQIIDLSLEMKDGSLSYPGTASGLALERVDMSFPGSTLSRFAHLDPHCGTHLDAPLHFVSHANDVASQPLALPELVIISSILNPIPADVLIGQLSLAGKAVLFLTGWEKKTGTAAFFEGFPSLSPELAKQLVSQGVALVGLDSPSVDPADSTDYPAHRALLSAGIPIAEGLVNLPSLLPVLERGEHLYFAAFPLRIRGLEGSPVRAVAISF